MPLQSKIPLFFCMILFSSVVISCNTVNVTSNPSEAPTISVSPESAPTITPTDIPTPTVTPVPSVTPFAGSVGGLIAFSIQQGPESDIFAMDTASAEPIRITDVPGNKTGLAWSGDGKRIAFASNLGKELNLYVMDADGSNLVQITSGIVGAARPSWSPDGTKIVFQGILRQMGGEILVVDLADSQIVNLTNHPDDDFAPSWSPDGSTIAFASSRHNGLADVYVMRADGSEVNRITEIGSITNVVWSPDGSRILFDRIVISEAPGATLYDITSMIYVVNADGSDLVQLTDEARYTTDSRWSPDGTMILFSERSDDGNWHIMIMNSDGTEASEILSHPNGLNNPAWQP